MIRQWKWWVVVVVLGVLGGWAVLSGLRHARAVAFWLRFDGKAEPGDGSWGRLLHEVVVSEFALRVNTDVRVRRFRPSHPSEKEAVDDVPGIMLLHGAHPRGIDERRLQTLATALSSLGIEVFTPELVELTQFRIEADTVHTIAELASRLAAKISRPSIAVMGISFAGGLSLMAAAQEPDSIRAVIALGAHHDLVRVTRWYAGEKVFGPNRERAHQKPHPYGAGVFLYAHANDFFTPHELPEARRVMQLVLDGQRGRAAPRYDNFSETGRSILGHVLERTSDDQLRTKYLHVVEKNRAELVRASPRERLSKVRCPVFLIHGADDSVVPSTETLWLARELPPGIAQQVLITSALKHARQQDRIEPADQWALVHFIASVLAEI